jgi:hypothetical protein
MVRHQGKSDHFGIVFCCDLSNQCFAAFSSPTDAHRPSIFWRPHQTVLAGVDKVVVRFAPFQRHVHSHTLARSITQSIF